VGQLFVLLLNEPHSGTVVSLEVAVGKLVHLVVEVFGALISLLSLLVEFGGQFCKFILNLLVLQNCFIWLLIRNRQLCRLNCLSDFIRSEGWRRFIRIDLYLRRAGLWHLDFFDNILGKGFL
jgi:hypothetical protein